MFRISLKSMLLLFVVLSSLHLQAQAIKGKPDTTQNVKPDFKLFFEKSYLHTDREYYAAGEDIWFKAYLFNAQNNHLFNSSYNLYVELISPQSTITERKMVRLEDGLGTGDFKLPNSVPTGTYRLRAYTNWMLNYGDNFIFEKEIHIYNDIKAATRPAIVVEVKPQKKAKPITITPATVSLSPVEKTASIRFFPEGGSLIQGVTSVVAFKAEDANGKGIKAKGSIYTSDGDKITDFEGDDYGMGSFLLLPQEGKSYGAKGTFNNTRAFTIQLPGAMLKGFSVQARTSDSVVKVIISTNSLTLKDMQVKQVKISGTSKGQMLFTASVNLSGLQTLVNIPRSTLPQGITAVTLTDANSKPLCERLIYNECADKANITITPDKVSYYPKGKVSVRIKTTNQQGVPVKAHLSLAVVDAGLVPQNSSDIRSYLYLQSEIKGKIENPGQYFDERNPQRLKQLDLLLLTQGWRDFVWKRLADSALRISYELEQGITIAGRVRGIWGNKGEPGMNITLYADNAKGDKLFTTQTDLKGQYAFYGLNLAGTQQVVLSSVNAKGKKSGYVLIDTVLKKPYPVTPVPAIVDSIGAVKFKDAVIKGSALEKKYHVTPLYEVRITAQPLPVLKTVFDTTINMARNDYKLKTLAEYIVEKIPGFFLSLDHRTAYTLLYGRPAKTIVTVDSLIPYGQIKRIKQFIWDISLEKIIDIRYRHVIIHENLSWKQQAWGFKNGMADNNFWIELKLKPHALDNFDFHTSHYDVEGYYEARTFYAPKYESETTQPDYRTTIHWVPNITTEFGEAVINYYNATPATKVKIIAEGITITGIPVTGVSGYEVK